MAGVTKTIAVLKGDGIGPEVTSAAIEILEDCAKSFEHKFDFRELAFGGAAIERFGSPLPAETLAGCRSADAILLGAIGGPQWDGLPLDKRPEAGLLGLRKALGLYINLRPIRLRPALSGISPLRRERIEDCDFEIVRELAGRDYRRRPPGGMHHQRHRRTCRKRLTRRNRGCAARASSALLRRDQYFT